MLLAAFSRKEKSLLYSERVAELAEETKTQAGGRKVAYNPA